MILIFVSDSCLVLGSGDFEITEGSVAVVKGTIESGDGEIHKRFKEKASRYNTVLWKEDFYKEQQLRGYQFTGDFCKIHVTKHADIECSAKIEWNENWVSFMDSMIQVGIGIADSRDTLVPTFIRRLVILPQAHEKILAENPDNNLVDLVYDYSLKAIQSGGVVLYELDASHLNRTRSAQGPLLESYSFVPHFSSHCLNRLDLAKFCTQLLIENESNLNISIVEVDANDDKEPLCEIFAEVMEKSLMVEADISYLTEKEVELKDVAVKNEKLSVGSKFDLIITSSLSIDLFTAINDHSDRNFFILSRQSCNQGDFNLPENYKCIACVIVEDEWMYLVWHRKSLTAVSSNIVEIPTNFHDFKWIEELKSTIKLGPTIIHSKTDENFSGILGFFNCLRREPDVSGLRCFLIENSSAPKFSVDEKFYKKQLDLGLAVNIYKSHQWGTYRHLSLENKLDTKPQTDHCYANVLVRGDLSSLTWLQGWLDVTREDNDLIEVHYSALNLRDVLVASKRINLDSELDNRVQRQFCLGYEFSGVTKENQRVMGLTPINAFATHVRRDEVITLDVPDHWTLHEAATVPIIYLTVYKAFFSCTHIEEGKLILIHAGSGGIGLAAIRIALAYGLKVFTTVSTKEKRDFLLQEFLELKEEHIGNSRDTTFEEMVMAQSNGKGVDYVLNSLADDKMQASIRCLADNGVFLEVGKYDMLMKNKIDLSHFLRGITFKAVLLNLKQFPQVIELVSHTSIIDSLLVGTDGENTNGNQFRHHQTTQIHNFSCI
jgi:fatty acid synthase, animal type